MRGKIGRFGEYGGGLIRNAGRTVLVCNHGVGVSGVG